MDYFRVVLPTYDVVCDITYTSTVVMLANHRHSVLSSRAGYMSARMGPASSSQALVKTLCLAHSLLPIWNPRFR